ncbi:HAMP domain-containing sensor histidine kinase [Dyadobacter jiangsuensis]|uniref:histidine kinase n=1 Tax=Dyadobacter jiangsuensis TaxID=1591085 RepID=A0A2P8GBT2_9BACT|nr:HAMP domain-containing sensor histidine kinase [Dyadobacter jiangsuensis]PSL31427.1 signal transduction histidine kinase [Dyadobacter jiangsuensis]
MKIRTRLIILFTVLTIVILSLFATVIFQSAKKSREREYYDLLKKEALTKANLFFNARVEKQTLQQIYRNNRKTLNEVEVAVYDTAFVLLYHDALDIDFVKEDHRMIRDIYSKGQIQFFQQGWQVVGLSYDFDGRRYAITAAGYDQYGYNKSDSLLVSIFLVFGVSILFIVVAGIFFSRKAFEPVADMISKAKSISVSNLDMRLPGNGSKDELADLAGTFNEMLDRLESSFDAQKRFVSNISHELRTPLSTIITELELSADNGLTEQQYTAAIRNALNDSRRLARLANSLLDFAKASYDPSEITFKPVRIDELLLDARQQLQKADPTYKVDIHFEGDFENDEEISVNGNLYLLKVAFANLFENGCKFSDERQSSVSVSFGKDITLHFSDHGIGIAPDDLPSIFTPFYRGQNGSFADGNGIGLSLTQKIVGLHKGTISVTSTPNLGTTFTVMLPAIGPPVNSLLIKL